MKTSFVGNHWDNKTSGRGDGGTSYGTGFCISWHRGPILNTDGTLDQPNGAFIEDIIGAALDRLEYHQRSQFPCEENEQAIALLTQALEALDQRTQRRKSEGVLGSHQPEDSSQDAA